MKWKTNGKRFLALLLTVVLLLSVCPVTASAEETDGLCPHHTAHDATCGYVQGSPCTHEHVGTCYEWVTKCTHQHVATCYEWVTKCTHQHVATCYSDGVRPAEGEEKQADACTHQCSEDTGCLTRGEKICTHQCSEASGCLIRGKEDCKHEHMATECGYVESHDCKYQCDICEEVPASVKAFLNAVKQIQIPSKINEETVAVFAEQIRTASDAYEKLSAEEIQRDDVQQASITLQTAMAIQSGGTNPMALLTGEEFSIVVNVGYLDDTGNFVRTGSKTMVSTCRYGTGHSGYNHTMNAQEIVNASGYTGNSWRVTRYGYWDDPANTTTVNYNITGSAPYKADQAIWIIGDKPTVDGGNSGGTTPGTGGESGGSGSLTAYVKPVYIKADGTYEVQNVTKEFKFNCPTTTKYHTHGKNCTLNGTYLNYDFFSVPEGYTRVGCSNQTSKYWPYSSNPTFNYNNSNGTPTYYVYYQAPAQAQTNTISLTYDAQGGKVEGKDTHTISISTTDKSYSFQSLEPVRDGYNFLGWYDGTSDNAHKISWPYTLGLVGSATSINKIVYAKWEKQSDTHENATIIYQNGGGSGGPVTEIVPGSAEYTIKSPGDVGITAPNGKVFSHWAKGNDIYFSGDKFVPADGSTNTFVAVWKDDDSETGNATYTVSWYDNDGNSIKTTETRNGTLNMPVSVTEADKTVTGYIFNETDSRNVLQAVLEKETGTELKLYFTKDENYVPISKAGDSTMNITKKFVGIDSAPNGFQLNYSYTDLATNQVVTGTVALTGTGDTLTGTLSLPYYHNVATGETYKLTITEQNADVDGYTMSISGDTTMSNIIQDAHSFQYAISATTESGLNRTITNTYTKNQPSTDWSGLTITKTASPSGTVKPGDTITYTITVKNETGKALKNITVSEKLDENLTFVSADPQYDSKTGVWTIPALADGSSTTLTITATVNNNVADGTKIKNNAAITDAEDSDGGKPGEDDKLPGDSADVTVTIPQETPALTVTKTADKTEVAPGETVTYTISVKNNTSETISGIVLKDTLPDGLAGSMEVTGGGFTYASGEITFESFDLAADKTKEFTVTVAYADVTASVTKTNTATATSGDKDYTGTADVTVKPADIPTAPDWSNLKITKTADKTEVKPGDTVTYTITVENQTGKNLNDVIISEKLDTNLIFVSATPGDLYNSTDNAWTIPILENDITATLTITATVSKEASGKIPNTVTVTGAKTEDGGALPEDGQPAGSVDITVKPDEPVKPDWDKLTISKSANPKDVKRGETITYTIRVQNNTGVMLDTVTVQETPDSNLTVTGHSQGAAYDAEKNVWTITGLANGAEAKLTVTATVNADTTASVVWNTASITSASAGGGETLTGKPSDSISVVVTDPKPTAPEPETDWDGLTLKKTANRSSVRPGKTITYTLTVTNKTGKDLTDIAVSEKLDANLTFVSSSGDGKYDVKTGEWTIGKLENGGKATLTLKATVKTGLKDGTVIKNTACITDAGAENGDTLPTDAQPSGSANVTVSNKISVIPQTGDTSSIGLWIGVMVACAVVLGVVLVFTVKKKKTR